MQVMFCTSTGLMSKLFERLQSFFKTSAELKENPKVSYVPKLSLFQVSNYEAFNLDFVWVDVYLRRVEKKCDGTIILYKKGPYQL